MTPIRPKRGGLVHLSADLRKTLCGRKAEGWKLAPDELLTCSQCAEIDLDIAVRGN